MKRVHGAASLGQGIYSTPRTTKTVSVAPHETSKPRKNASAVHELSIETHPSSTIEPRHARKHLEMLVDKKG